MRFFVFGLVLAACAAQSHVPPEAEDGGAVDAGGARCPASADGPVRIASDGPFEPRPQVVWDGAHFFFAARELDSTPLVVRATWAGPDGTVLRPGENVYELVAAAPGEIGVLADGFMVYDDSLTATRATSTFLPGIPTLVLDDAGYTRLDRGPSDSSPCIAVYQRLALDGAAIGDEVHADVPGASCAVYAGRLDAVRTSAGTLTVFPSDGVDADPQLVRASADGRIVTEPFAVDATGAYSPQLVVIGDDVLAVWTTLRDGHDVFRARRYDAAGHALADTQTVVETASSSLAFDVATDGEAALLVYAEGTTDVVAIRAQHIDAGGAPVGTPIPLATARLANMPGYPPEQDTVKVVWADCAYGVVWADRGAVGPRGAGFVRDYDLAAVAP